MLIYIWNSSTLRKSLTCKYSRISSSLRILPPLITPDRTPLYRPAAMRGECSRGSPSAARQTLGAFARRSRRTPLAVGNDERGQHSQVSESREEINI